MNIQGVLESSLYVSDLDAAERFYRDVLGLQLVVKKEGRHVFFRCGETMVLLFDPEASAASKGPVPPHGSHGPGHVAFSVGEDELAQWRGNLLDHAVAIEQELDWPQGGRSLYFRDPAGNSLELATPTLWFGD